VSDQQDWLTLTQPVGHNYLPVDGEVYYWPGQLAECSAQYTRRLLEEVRWQHDEAVIYGKRIVTRRQYAWFADQPYEYSYSGVTRRAVPWTALISDLRSQTEAITGKRYNSCLLNLYPDGASGMAWHRDDERDLALWGSIASLSFGASRKFAMKHLTSGEKVDFVLHSGDLLEMCGVTQDFWQHSVPKTRRVDTPRVNLTFRQMVG
jgi:alkylated DNA repair dioxygenase AlkB